MEQTSSQSVPVINSNNREHQKSIHGNRPCTNCNYNLTGQTITREDHYNMLMVRCPECGTVAAIQEQALLGKWANRWGLVIAALWIAFTTLFFFGSTAGLTGISLTSGVIASQPFQEVIGTEYKVYLAINNPDKDVEELYLNNYYGQEFSDWWKEQNVDEIIKKNGGYYSCIDFNAFFLWIPLFIATMLFGIFFSTVLSNWSILRLVIMVVITAIMLFLWGWLYVQPANYSYGIWIAAEQAIAPLFMYISIAFTTIALIPSMLFGRTFARLLVKAFLPPRMQASLSVLWITDGKEPPCFPPKN